MLTAVGMWMWFAKSSLIFSSVETCELAPLVVQQISSHVYENLTELHGRFLWDFDAGAVISSTKKMKLSNVSTSSPWSLNSYMSF